VHLKVGTLTILSLFMKQVSFFHFILFFGLSFVIYFIFHCFVFVLLFLKVAFGIMFFFFCVLLCNICNKRFLH
jgi:hypothetical protein